jgi:hypothetical protein
MFDRNSKKFTDTRDWCNELPRFDEDEFLAKYLTDVFNPEFKIRIAHPKDVPNMSVTCIGFNWCKRKFNKVEEVC